MEKAQAKILNMVKEGNLSAEEANRLIAEAEAREADVTSGAGEPEFPAALEQARQLRRFWQPTMITFLAVAGMNLRGIMRSREQRGIFSFVKGSFSWLFFLTAGLGALLAHWSRNAPWIYINVEPKDGPTVRLAFPLPLGLIAKLTEFAASQETDPDEIASIRGAAEFLRAMQEQLSKPGSPPIYINVEDEDEHVEVFIGI
ncbi:MAG: hypothetical protein JW910_01555 [Anaerolineae bacterium]|nr:hypothetical protein [Anaerolineae bacterium]